MQQYFEELRKTKEIFRHPETKFQKLEVSPKKKTFRHQDDQVRQDEFSNILDDIDKSNIYAAKTRKYINDFSKSITINDNYFDENNKSKLSKIDFHEKSRYAGNLNLFFLLIK